MSGIADAAVALWSAVSSFSGETVVYSRASSTVSVTAVPSRPELMTDDMIASRLEAEALDWTVLASSLMLSSTIVKPREGDRITRTSGEIFELTESPYRLSDSAGVRLRLHSKKVGT